MRVTGKGSGRISIAAMTCYKPDQRARLIYRMMLHRGRKGEKKGFREHDFAALLDAAHQQLGGPIVLVWDNLGGHTSTLMRQLTATRTWLRVYQLPSYAPELNHELTASRSGPTPARAAPTTIFPPPRRTARD